MDGNVEGNVRSSVGGDLSSIDPNKTRQFCRENYRKIRLILFNYFREVAAGGIVR